MTESTSASTPIATAPQDSTQIELKECALSHHEVSPLGIDNQEQTSDANRQKPPHGNPLSTDADSDGNNDEAAEEESRSGYIKAAVSLFLIAFVAFVVVDSLTNAYIRDGTTDFLEWVEENPGGGVILFTVVIFFTTMLFIPGIILTFGSGYVFSKAFGLGGGVVLGSLSVMVGACSGAMASFLLGRFLIRDCVSKLIHRFKLLKAIDSAMEEKGLTIMLLLRLSPVIFVSPYLNYGSGGLSISFWNYSIALLAVFPSAVMFVFLGASAGSLSDSSGGGDSTTTLIVTIVGIIFSVIAIGVTTYYARRELQKITQSQEGDENPDEEAQTTALNETQEDVESIGEQHQEAATLEC